MTDEKLFSDLDDRGFIDPTSDRAAPLRPLVELWNASCPQDCLPPRSAFPMDVFVQFLGTVTIVDVINDGEDYRYRLFGTSIQNVSGVDMTGKLVSEHPDPDSIRMIQRGFSECLARSQPLIHHTLYRWRGVRRDIARLLMPVWCENSGNIQIIGVTEHKGPEATKYHPSYSSIDESEIPFDRDA